MALRCDVALGKLLVVLTGPELASGYAVAEGSFRSVAVYLVDGGMGMASFPEGARSVLIHAADGTVLTEVPIFTA